LIKAYKLKPLFGSTFVSFNGYTKSIPNTFLIYLYRFLASYLGSAIMYNTYDKENTDDDDDDVTGTYILLSGILAVITSAVNGTTSSPAAVAAAAVVVVDVRCSLYPNTSLLV
jgi:hypothetical protein